MPTYNKLVRDKIPGIIKTTGKRFRTRKLSEQEYIIELRRKLLEEIAEYEEAGTDEQALEELADVMEVIKSLAEFHGSSIDEIERIREMKYVERGGFREKVFLIDVSDE
ncbi:nucleoside triphosphate pyrophosphohydrolase [Bacillus sinesaloumensis]|uniref:nucleoside triphosphate pyrophosphohydrolase n=1 Tax=Litchfieldia sinesaloumensis TaxID=1926280 RepID=UPI0009884AEB|nr:nucleoside triphosphate pyrophosphohydrolase [Bacillus sinesaloumensis]